MTVNVIIEGTLKEGERENFTGICTEDRTLDDIASMCEDAPSIRIFDIIPT